MRELRFESEHQLTLLQEAALSSLCDRYHVAYDPRHYAPSCDLPPGYVCGWVGGFDIQQVHPTIYVGCSPEGRISSQMELIDQFYQPETIDCYTFVFDEVTPETGFHTMLAMSADSHQFSQWTSGRYDPSGENAHLGCHMELRDLGSAVLDAFFARLSIPNEWELIYRAVEEP